jgi:hypothetical protein
MQKGTTVTSEVCCKTPENLCRAPPWQCMSTYSSYILGHCWSISTGSCLTTFLTTLISLQVTTTCWPVDLKLMVSKCSWTHKQQTPPQYGRCLCHGMTMLSSSLSMYIFFVYNFFSLLVLVTIDRRLLSKYPLYFLGIENKKCNYADNKR